MRMPSFLLCLCLAGAAPLAAQRAAQSAAPANDREAVRQAVLDYVEGVYERAPERIERSVHPQLTKTGYMVGDDSVSYRPGSMTFERLLQVARDFNRSGWIPPHAPKHIEIFEVLDQTATAKLTAVWGIDYFHLAKYDGRWKIVNVLWQSPPEEHPAWQRPQPSLPANDLAGLGSGFDEPGALAGWTWHHEAEGWTNKLRRMDVSRTRAGSLYMEPHTSVWFYDYTAPYVFRAVSGDFMVTTRVRVTGTEDPYPQSSYSLAGVMLRRPRADAPYGADSAWAKDREDYVFAVTGTTDRAGVPILETKSAVRSRPLVKHYPLDRQGWLELRLVRLGPTVLVLYRHEGGEWRLHERFHRPDLPAELQVGLMAYADFGTIDRSHWYQPWEYNTKVIADGAADLAAEFDWIRFDRVAVPAEAAGWMRAQGAVAWDDHRLTNDDLLRVLPFIAVVEGAAAEAAAGGAEPELVQEGVISTAGNETFPAIDPVDGSLWMSVYDESFDMHRVVRAARGGEGWTSPVEVSFGGGGAWGWRAPRFSPDGQRLYLTSNRPDSGAAAGPGMRLWMAARRGSGWSPPVLVPSVNATGRAMHASESRAGELFYAAYRGRERADIYRAERRGAGWGEGVPLEAPVNDALGQPDVLISPDGSWMILVVTNHPEGLGGDDLFLSRRVNGRWTAPRPLGAPFNSSEYEYGPSLSTDGRTLYFTSHRRGSADIYRVPFSSLMPIFRAAGS